MMTIDRAVMRLPWGLYHNVEIGVIDIIIINAHADCGDIIAINIDILRP